MTEKERLIKSVKAIEEFLCEKEPRVGDALFVCGCILMNMESNEVYSRAAVDAIYDAAFPKTDLCAGCQNDITAAEGATLDWGSLWHHKCYEKERDARKALAVSRPHLSTPEKSNG